MVLDEVDDNLQHQEIIIIIDYEVLILVEIEVQILDLLQQIELLILVLDDEVDQIMLEQLVLIEVVELL